MLMSVLGRNGRWVQRWVLRGRILSLKVQVNSPLPTSSDYWGSFPTEGVGPWWVVGFTRVHPVVFSRLRGPGLASPTHTHKHQVGLPPPTALFSSLCHKPGAMVEVGGWVVPPTGLRFLGTRSPSPPQHFLGAPNVCPQGATWGQGCPEPLDKNQDGVQG